MDVIETPADLFLLRGVPAYLRSNRVERVELQHGPHLLRVALLPRVDNARFDHPAMESGDFRTPLIPAPTSSQEPQALSVYLR